MFMTGFSTNDFLGQLIPNIGAINTQAWYNSTNQTNATNRMNLGDTPNQIIDWLILNDVQSAPELRQYGIVAMVNGSPQAAAYTGTSTDNYKNHIIGDNYVIQGNILLGQSILDSMETRFLNTTGSLSQRLMASLQGAKVVGADTRCYEHQVSSLSAFLRVAKENDNLDDLFIDIIVESTPEFIDPIDIVQDLSLIHI